MTFEEYQQKIAIINQRFEQISRLTSNMAFAGTANTDNPRFISLMSEFDRMLKCSEELTEQMIRELQS